MPRTTATTCRNTTDGGGIGPSASTPSTTRTHALRARVAELEEGLTAILPTLNEGAASGMVPFQECKDNYARACKLLGVQPQP